MERGIFVEWNGEPIRHVQSVLHALGPDNIALARLCDQVGPRTMRGTGVERWVRVIFEPELDRFRDVLAKGLCRDPQREIDAGRDAATGYQVAVDDHPFGNRRGAKSRQHVVAHPVGCGTLALEQSSSSQDECAGAHARHVASTLRMTPDEGQRLRVIEERVHPCAPRHADQIKRRALRERGGRQNLHASVRRHWLAVLPHEMDVGIRKFREDLVWAGQVELGDVGEEQEADVERHCVPRKLGRVPVSLAASNNGIARHNPARIRSGSNRCGNDRSLAPLGCGVMNGRISRLPLSVSRRGLRATGASRELESRTLDRSACADFSGWPGLDIVQTKAREARKHF